LSISNNYRSGCTRCTAHDADGTARSEIAGVKTAFIVGSKIELLVIVFSIYIALSNSDDVNQIPPTKDGRF
jgi:hypothetical protein